MTLLRFPPLLIGIVPTLFDGAEGVGAGAIAVATTVRVIVMTAPRVVAGARSRKVVGSIILFGFIRKLRYIVYDSMLCFNFQN